MQNEIANPGELLLESPAAEPGRNGSPHSPQARTNVVGGLRLMWEHRVLLVRVVGAGLLLSLLLALLIPVRYESTARLMPPDQDSGNASAMLAAVLGGFSGSAGGIGQSLLGLKTSGDLFSGVLRSRTVEDDLIGKFDLLKVYGYRSREDGRRMLTERTDISVDRKSGIIAITVTDHKANRAAAMTRAYIDDLNQMMTQLNTSSARRERVFLEQRLDQVRVALEASEKDFSEFASKNTAIDIEAQGKAMIGAAATLEGQLIAAQTELESVRQVYSDNNVRVRTMQARVDELERQVQKLGGSSSAGAGGGADADASAKDDRFVYPTIRTLPLLGVTYADLYRAMKVQDALFASLTQQYEIAKVEEAKEVPSVKVLDEPDVPEKKSYPPRTEIVLVGTSLAAILGVSLVFVRGRWDEMDPHDPARIFTQELLEGVRSRVHVMAGNGSGATGIPQGAREPSNGAGRSSG